MSGSNGSRYLGVHVVESAKPVRPWKLPVNATRSRPDLLREYALARQNLSAASRP